jgi:hypothetical protein
MSQRVIFPRSAPLMLTVERPPVASVPGTREGAQVGPTNGGSVTLPKGPDYLAGTLDEELGRRADGAVL